MTDHDKGFLDKVKDALGMDSDADADRDEGLDRGGSRIEMERGGGGDVLREPAEPIGGISGAPQAAGRVGASGGTGASATMGGAGAGGPIGDDPLTRPAGSGEPADAGAVRTEYEMGHEPLVPEHERHAESGYLAERTGTAVNDTWGDRPPQDPAVEDAPSRREAASAFERDEDPDR